MKAAKQTDLRHYLIQRYGISGVVLLGIVVSMLLNVKHAPSAGGWVASLIGGWPPAAVFLCIELISRVPVVGRWSSVGRVLMALGVSGIAAWISYEQQAEYVMSLGFTGLTAKLLPATIDGVMGVATVSLIEVSKIIRKLRAELAEIDAPAVAVAPVADLAPEPAKSPQVARRRGRKPGSQDQGRFRTPPRTTLKADKPKAGPQDAPKLDPVSAEPVMAEVPVFSDAAVADAAPA